MPPDSDTPPTGTHRDWFFPSPSYFPQSNPRSDTLTRNSRNFSQFRSPNRAPPKPYFSPSRSLNYPSNRSFSSPPSISPQESRYAEIRRRVDTASHPEKSSNKAVPEAIADVRADASKPVKGFKIGASKVRWKFVFTMVVIGGLQEQILELNIRLRACNVLDSMEGVEAMPQDNVDTTNKRMKKSALFLSLAVLAVPILLFKYLDCVPSLRNSPENNKNPEEVSLNKQLAYRADVFLSVHPYAKPLALLLATLLLICLGGMSLYGATDDNLADCLWLSWTYVADSGNHANSVGFGPKLVSVSISFGGMLIFAMMLGLVSDAISEKFDSLRKGKSEVIEKNHTLILGWSDKLQNDTYDPIIVITCITGGSWGDFNFVLFGSLLNQLGIANASLGAGTVVVMAERDKEEMELDIAKMEFNFRGTSVICRSGSPLILADLKKVSVSKARAVIVLAEDGNADQSDARALRTVLSLTGIKEGLRGHIVVEMSDLDNEVLVKLVGGDLVETVVAHDVIGRLMIQCARQPGLAQIWEDILGFENCEFYIKRWPKLDGIHFEDVLISFPDAIPCGIKVASNGGKIILNPDDSYVLQEGDEVLVIAEDDDTYSPATPPMVKDESFIDIARPTRKPQKILFCGWRRDIDDMIGVWRGYLPKDFVVPKSPERILFCGWRRDMEDMIMVGFLQERLESLEVRTLGWVPSSMSESKGMKHGSVSDTYMYCSQVLDAFLASGSELWMFNDVPEKVREKKLIEGGLDTSRLMNISIVNREGNAVIRRHLESLPLESFDSILILADESVEDSAIQADSRSLATLLLIRDIQQFNPPAEAKRLPYREAMVNHLHSVSFSQGSWIGEMQQASNKSVIISEILDPRTKNLLSMSKISDYVLSNELVSMALAMVAEDRQINDVLEELFAEEFAGVTFPLFSLSEQGNELHIRLAVLYLHEDEELSFYEILLRARQRKEIVIGYRLLDAERAVINPPNKSERRRWSLKDAFVVIAEKE
ncbi:hypothetical protein ACLOJK_011712 [Asimina triloba]